MPIPKLAQFSLGLGYGLRFFQGDALNLFPARRAVLNSQAGMEFIIALPETTDG
jgi:hypothetical protein